ncbi:MAG: S8 family peptidase [Cyclobacteriaceae bacterium]|nr:S8 family peptidase [Cyclobacteriaceae bacterium]
MNIDSSTVVTRTTNIDLIYNLKLKGNSIEKISKFGENLYLIEIRKENIISVIKQLKNYSEQIFYSYSTDFNRKLVCTNEILIKLKNRSIDDVLKSFSSTIDHVEFKGLNTYKVTVKANYDALAIANSIYQKGIVEYSHPNFYADIVRFQNDPLYPEQYYLNNTGQFGGTAGIDINAPEAWVLTTGLNPVRVAVIDDGVENHTELGGRVLQGFTPTNPTGFGAPNANGAHGQAVTGIIAATMDNSLNITGIAPCSDIIPINIFNGGETINDLAEAINWAWNQGQADVINNSWGFTVNGTFFDAIEDAITNARTLGRNGLGTVVVFASGNSNQAFSGVTHPADVDGVLTVGAITNNGAIWNYSSRGSEMDLVTPSGDVNLNGDLRTIDREGANGYEPGNFTTRFGGTSGACPQVSGAVALLISLNPFLTEQNITDILRNTATDMGTSGFDNTYGFGRLDISAAVVQAAPSISGSPIVCTSNSTLTLSALAAGTTITWSKSSNLTYVSGQGTNNYVVKANSSSTSGAGWVQGTLNNTGCNPVTLPRKTVWVGRPQDVLGIDDIAGPDCIIIGQPAYYHGLPWPTTVPGADSYEATIFGNSTGISVRSSTYRVLVKVLTSSLTPIGFRGMEIAPKNACGYGSVTYAFFDVQNSPRNCGGIGGPRLSVSPNPADSYIDIELSNKNVKTNTQLPVSNYTGEIENVEITILNDKNIPVYNKLMPGKKLQINTQNLPNGFYYLRIKNGEQVYSRQIVVKH